uniref:Odorant receptor family 30, subfamily BT, member 1 n=1 Tax=Astyanax mexicanus TaxID=7994 RepID=A0A3B1K6V8_ASTMX
MGDIPEFKRGQINFVIVGFPGLHSRYYGLGFSAHVLGVRVHFAGNGTFLLLFAREKRLRKPMYYILINLAVCDVLFSTTTLPKIISRYWFSDGYVSFTGCFVQMYFVHLFGLVHGLILAVMAFDRYVAVCIPSDTLILFKDSTILMLCVVAWMIPQSCVLMLVIRAYPLPYCAANTIIQCYCDHVAITKLACTDRTPYGFPGFVFAMVLLITPLSFILFSYTSIIIAVLRISTNQERLKAFSTCSSQLIIIALYFFTQVHLPPMINPLIYCLRAKEVREALFKSLEKSTFHFKRKINADVSTIC